jgi:ABC-type Fe3+-hydroxamate transport system substrate-binding protein
MRVVCLVPSLTETLIEAGVDVVGRSRFCIHPEQQVASIPVVGGTKEVDWSKVSALKADLLVLDQEENPRWMADESPVPWVATHITSVDDVETELNRLGEVLSSELLASTGERWRSVCESHRSRSRARDWLELPGVLAWIRQPTASTDHFVYLIWKDPWMAVGPGTFVASMFDLLGYGSRMLPLDAKYPTVRLRDFDSTRTLLLFSSEPYPFHQHKDMIAALPFPAAVVDGECFTWFGVRSLRFLEELIL